MTDEVAKQRFEQLFHLHFRAVLAYALARRDPESAKDIAAEVFVVAWRRGGDIPENALPWLLGTARKVMAGQIRSDRRWSHLGERLAFQAVSDAPLPDYADTMGERERVRWALGKLGPVEREILMVTGWDGLSGHDAATALGVSDVTFRVRLFRARRRFADTLWRYDNQEIQPGTSPAPELIGADAGAVRSQEEAQS